MTTQIHPVSARIWASTIGALLVATFLAGCAARPTSANTAAKHHDGEQHTKAAETNTTQRFRPLVIPPAAEPGDDVQVTKLLDEPQAKILCIRLRHGAEFPTHNASVPVIIQSATGAGSVIIGNDRVHIDDGQFVTLAPKTAHSVLPDSSADLVLIVTQLRGRAK